MQDIIDEKIFNEIRGPQGNLGYLFRLAHQALRSALERALEPHRLSPSQYTALSIFDFVKEVSSADLARLAVVKPQTMNITVHQLIEQGLLERRAHTLHRKVILLKLTPNGRKQLNNATLAVRAIENAIVEDVDPARKSVISEWLATIPLRLNP